MMKKVILMCFFIICSQLYAKDPYSELRKRYWKFEENDSRAFVLVNRYIKLAAKEKNYAELFQAYKDAILFSETEKLRYADSASAAAKLSGNIDLIADSHIAKGAVYYFTYRKYQQALDEYLKADASLANSTNKYLQYQNLYHIGVVKCYMGYYAESLEIFTRCAAYFNNTLAKDTHPNIIFNYKKGYLNSLHKSILCHQEMKNFKKADALTKIFLSSVPNNKDFLLEKSYSLKCEGVNLFHKKDYQGALLSFEKALEGLRRVNDFTWLSHVNFYRGMCYSKLGETPMAVSSFKKVDSIFSKHHFILPELRNNYEFLISYYKKSKEPKNELYYTIQLLKMDSIISNDFKYLAPKIHKEYDIKTLKNAKEDLEKKNFISYFFLSVLIFSIIILVILIYVKVQKQKFIQQKYSDLLSQMKDDLKEQQPVPLKETKKVPCDSKLDENILQKLLLQFENFEKKRGFLKQGLTLRELAENFESNTAYVSQFINDVKGVNFNNYINGLRISYAAHKIVTDKIWLKYSVEYIAAESGFNSRQSFSNAFLEHIGIRPADFIKQRKSEIDGKE